MQVPNLTGPGVRRISVLLASRSRNNILWKPPKFGIMSKSVIKSSSPISSQMCWVELNWLFNVPIDDISVIYVTAHRARRGGAEEADWTLDRKIRVRFPAYPHRVWALWWQGGKRRLRTSRCPCRGRLGTLNTPSCPWRGCPAAGQKLETGHLSCHYIAEISLNVTLNHNQQQRHIDVQADWRRWTQGRAPNAIDIPQGSLNDIQWPDHI